MEQQAHEHIMQNPNLTYEELVTQFGSPKDIVVGYYDSIDDDYLLKKLNFVKTIRNFLFVAIILIIGFIGYRSYMLYQIYLEAQEPVILYEDTTIEYINPPKETSDATDNSNHTE